MSHELMRPLTAALTLGVLAASLAVSAPAPVSTSGTVKDRENFIPKYKFQPLPGKVVGLLLSDVLKVIGP